MGLRFRENLMVLILSDFGMAKMCLCVYEMQIKEMALEFGQKSLPVPSYGYFKPACFGG